MNYVEMYENDQDELYEMFPELEEVLDGLDKLGKDVAPAFLEWMYQYDYDLDRAEDKISRFEEVYQGCFDSEAAFAEQLYNDIHTIPDYLSDYIDWEKVADDLFEYDYDYYDGHVIRSI